MILFHHSGSLEVLGKFGFKSIPQVSFVNPHYNKISAVICCRHYKLKFFHDINTSMCLYIGSLIWLIIYMCDQFLFFHVNTRFMIYWTWSHPREMFFLRARNFDQILLWSHIIILVNPVIFYAIFCVLEAQDGFLNASGLLLPCRAHEWS